MKHLVREVALEGGLRLLVPIGKELTTILSCKRMEEAVTVAGAPPCAIEGVPAPNAWIPGCVVGIDSSRLFVLLWIYIENNVVFSQSLLVAA